MTVDVAEERKKVHAELKTELFKRQLSNSDNFDKAILTYSSAGLALSLGFLKDFIPITRADASWLLFLSWALFVVAVVVTLISFISSQFGIARQLALNEKYYLRMDDSALSESNFFARCTDWLAYIAGTAFVVAIACSTIFVSINLERAAIMAEQKQVPLREGAPVPTIQQVPQTVQKGAPVPGIQQVPQQTTQGTGSTGATGSTGSTTNSSNNASGKP
ncbi:hypothetical protein [Methylococcus geothermalis]|uniref:Transmembrane protein n=1 Tax=Methylococcus geothermalis TaxID=2681310 RepID=A0A858QAP2_9GAMM|nr:hypothetical protein [Methylococcus geothermalis]QJD30959.1 hypothetical protein GNH96_14030 [Methylococcus geothermalis]